jgi:hypothetical protein
VINALNYGQESVSMAIEEIKPQIGRKGFLSPASLISRRSDLPSFRRLGVCSPDRGLEETTSELFQLSGLPAYIDNFCHVKSNKRPAGQPFSP